MHCIHCGAPLPDGAKFCTSCGKPVQDASLVDDQPVCEPTKDSFKESTVEYAPPVNASEGYKSANAQLPPSYSNPNYSSNSTTTYSAPGQAPSNGLAIAGFVCSLIFIPIGLGVLSAIAGLILSIMGINNSRKLPENKGHGLALAGTIISAVRIAIILIGIVAIFALMIRGIGHVGHELISNWSEINPYSF